jgi:transposase
MDLTQEQWHLVQPLLPPQPKSGGRGRPPLDQRRILDGILWKQRHRLPWRTVPSCYGSPQVCYLYYRRWHASGLLQKIHSALMQDLKIRGNFDPERGLRIGVVKLQKLRARYVIYILFPFSETWQASTSCFSIRWLSSTCKKKYGKGSGNLNWFRSHLLSRANSRPSPGNP